MHTQRVTRPSMQYRRRPQECEELYLAKRSDGVKMPADAHHVLNKKGLEYVSFV